MHTKRRRKAPLPTPTTPTSAIDRPDSFYLYQHIPETVLVWREPSGRRKFIVTDSACRIMSTLDDFGRRGGSLLFLATREHVLSPSGVLALGTYLKPGRGLALFTRESPVFSLGNRYAYRALSELLGLAWLPLSQAPVRLRNSAVRLLPA